MTGLLLITLILIEAGFMIFELTKMTSKREWTTKRLILNGTELIVFFMTVLLPGIDTSFRFKMLIGMLILRIVVAAIFWAANRKNDKTKKKAAIILGAILSICLISTSLFPAFMFTDYEGREVTGPYKVLQAQAIMIDRSRIEGFENDGSNREVPVYFFYPEGVDQKMPLIIFSHGAFGYYQSNASTYMELAGNGYVVASIEHPYHSMFTHDSEGRLIMADQNFFQSAMTIGSSDVSEAEVFDVTSEWMKLRIDDMNFAIDSLKEGNTDSWYIEKDQKEGVAKAVSLIDTSKIGLMGHSLGGATAVTVGRRDDVSAVIDLDGTMLGEEIGVKDGNVIVNEEPYDTPLLNFQTQEHHRQSEEARDKGLVYSNNVITDNADTVFETWFDNSGHMDFTDLPLFSPMLAKMLGKGDRDTGEMIDTVNSLVLSFYDCYLKGEGTFTVNEHY